MSMYWTSRRRAQTYRDSGCLIWNSVIRCWTLTTLREQVAGSCNVLAWRKSYHGLLQMITRSSLVTSSHSLMTCADCQWPCLKCIVSLIKMVSSLFRWSKMSEWSWQDNGTPSKETARLQVATSVSVRTLPQLRDECWTNRDAVCLGNVCENIYRLHRKRRIFTRNLLQLGSRKI